MSTKCKRMHIDRTYQITVSHEPAGAADPISVLGLMTMPTARTLARCSSFRASEARDVSLLRFVSEIVDVFAIFPQGQTLIVMSAIISIAYAMRIANKQGSYLILNANIVYVVKGGAGRLVVLPCNGAGLPAPFVKVLFSIPPGLRAPLRSNDVQGR